MTRAAVARLAATLAFGRATVTIALVCTCIAPTVVGAEREQAPSRARDLYTRARALQTQGNHHAALALLWEAAGLAPGDADIQNDLGEALDRIGALDGAIDAYRGALAARPEFRKAANNLILTLAKAGRGPEAVERARAIVAAAPDDPNAHFTLGLALSEQDIAEAIKTFRRVLEMAPRHALARYNLAQVLKRADRTAEAIDELTRAIATEPRAEAHYTLGVIYWQQGDLDRAVSALGAAIAAEPRYADAHYTLGTVLGAKREWTAAADALRRAIELRPDLWSAHYTLGRILRSAGDEAAARRHFAEAERLRQRAQVEQEASVWTTTGIQKLESGDPAGAMAHFERATNIYEAYAPAHYQLGRALQRLGRHDAARAAFARAHELNPSLVPPRETR
jgi:tetratricopeptide (TPR) repeat protein